MANVTLNNFDNISSTTCRINYNIVVDDGSDWFEDPNEIEIYVDNELWTTDYSVSSGNNTTTISNLQAGTSHRIRLLLRYTYWEQDDEDNEWYDYNYTDWSTTKTMYTRPKAFTFANCSSGKQWKIDEGINSLITNIEEFQDVATAWKNWSTQSSNSSCPSFFSNGYITANAMTNVYNYVGLRTTWNKGDIISAKMFNDLANTINS